LKKDSLGLVHVYTGNGKGKTTAALGQAMRAAGHGYKILIIQFMKGRTYGELVSARKLKNIKIVQSGTDEFVCKGNLKKKDIDLAARGMRAAEKAINGMKYDIVILDEINVAMDFGLVPTKDVAKLVKNRPDKVELILTGRNAPKDILKLADLVTEMKEVKHPYRKGIECRKGIEW